MFNSIVVGYDGSDPSVRALEMACEIAMFHSGELHIVHAPEAGSPLTGIQALEDAAGIAKTLKVHPASATIGDQSPCDEIMKIVDLYEADLIVTGRRGLGGVSGLIMGSTSQKLAQIAKCACMTVS